MPKQHRSKRLEDIRARTSLETRLKVSLMMEDYTQWSDGEYNGSMDRINSLIKLISKEVEEFLKDNKEYNTPIYKKKIEKEHVTPDKHK